MSNESGEIITLQFLSNPRVLSVVRHAVTSAAAVVGLESHDADNVCMAVDEACANIIRHCYGGRCDGPIEMELYMGDDRLVVTLRDQGNPFDPEQVPPRDLDEVRPGGLGLPLIQKLMDDVAFRPGPETGTELILTKLRTPTREVPDGR